MRTALLSIICIAAIARTTASPVDQLSTGGGAVPDARLVRALGKSTLPLLADLAWIRTISLSTRLQQPSDGLVLISWSRFITELDERFVWAYMMGGLLGPVSAGPHTYNAREAEALLRRGVEQLPGDYRLCIYLAFTQLYLTDDVVGAAETMRRAAAIPGAPAYVGPLATRLLAQSNLFDAAHALATELAEQGDEEVRAFFAQRSLEIARDEGLAQIEAAVRDFQRVNARAPDTLVQLVIEGFLPALPTDPLGGEYRLEPDGTVSATSGKRLTAHMKHE